MTQNTSRYFNELLFQLLDVMLRFRRGVGCHFTSGRRHSSRPEAATMPPSNTNITILGSLIDVFVARPRNSRLVEESNTDRRSQKLHTFTHTRTHKRREQRPRRPNGTHDIQKSHKKGHLTCLPLLGLASMYI